MNTRPNHPPSPAATTNRARLRRWRRLLLAGVVLGLGSCGREAVDQILPTDAKTYEMRGRILEFAPGRETVTIEHENVPGFMPAMIMPFYVKDPTVIARTKVGDAVSFRFVLVSKDSWIDRLATIDESSLRLAKAPRVTPPPTSTSPRVREGDRLPDFRLIDQDGKAVTDASFAGESLILTFIFTRCPVPNFCPLMTSHFEELQRALAKAAGPRAKLLSISFDTEFDQPAILKAYGDAHGANPAIWTVATGEREEINKLTSAFAVYVKPEGGTLSHGLCTALVDRRGTIIALWRGNGWSADEVMQKLAAADSAAR